MLNDGFKTLEIKDGRLIVLDQTKLPNDEIYIEAETTEDVYDYIKRLVVRGSTLIGATAGYGMWIALKEVLTGMPADESLSEEEIYVIDMAYREKAKYLESARPTAVNLSYAVKRILKRFDYVLGTLQSTDPKTARAYITARNLVDEVFEEAEAIRIEDENASRRKGEYALELLEPGMTILTHCNAGGLASVGYGGAFAPIYIGNERDYDFKVYADETRPLLQGARLTAWELARMGVDVTLICDNMAATCMKQGRIDAVIVGCDRMAANGDAANKIGTSGLAVLAEKYNIPFYFSVSCSTIDLNTATGDDIVIEERDGEEICELWYEKRMAPKNIKTYNPCFDVTDNELITAVFTEKGVVYPPYDVNLRKLMEE